MNIKALLYILISSFLAFSSIRAQDFNFTAVQTAGQGLADVKVEIVEPSETTADSYNVTFSRDESGNYLYSISNISTQSQVFTGIPIEEVSPEFDGVRVTVVVPQALIEEIVEVKYGGSVVEPPVHVFRQGDRQGRGGNNSREEYAFISGGGGSFQSVALFEGNTFGNDYEIRFDGNEQQRNYLIYGFIGNGATRAPFSVWNIGRGTPDDTTDDYQVLAMGFDDSGNYGAYDGGAPPSDGGPGDMYDRIYVVELNPAAGSSADINSDGKVDYDDILNDMENIGADSLSRIISSRPYYGGQVIRRLSLVNLTDNSEYVPPAGTVIRINTSKPPTGEDVFEFSTPDFGIYTEALSLSLGSVAVGSQYTLSLPVINSSASIITVSSINLGSDDFHVTPESFSLLPLDTEIVEITFSPEEIGAQTITMTINSTDASFPQYVLTLEGEGLPPFVPGEINILSRFDIKANGVKRSDVCDVWGYYNPETEKEYALVGYGVFTDPPNAGLNIIDVTNPSRPIEVAHMDNVPGFDVKTWQHYAYTVNGGGGTGYVIDLSDPANPQTVGTFPSTHNITIDDMGYMYQEGNGGVVIYDLNPDPTIPTYVWNGGSSGHDATIVDNILYDFHGSAGTFFYNITDRSDPILLGSITQVPEIRYHHSGWPTSDGKYVYICDELSFSQGDPTDITIWDISDFSNPVLVNSIGDSLATVHNLFIVNDYVYTSYYNAGFKVFDASDPVNPELIYQYDTEPNVEEVGYNTGAFGVYPFAPSGNIYVSDYNYGLFVFNSLDIETSVTNASIPARFTVYENYPNPFNPSTTISYELKEAGLVKISIYNVLGQKIRTLLNEIQKPGIKHLQWDGRNNEGRSVTSGVYYYRIKAERETIVKSMLLMK